MLTEHNYCDLKEEKWKPEIEECCSKDNPDNTQGCDCCYDNWTDELKIVKTSFSQADEEAKQVNAEYTFVVERRDKLKNWYDELTKLNELAQAICTQLDIFLCQTEKVTKNTAYTVKAIEILYCMVRDYFTQIDLLKSKYDKLLNCIRDLKENSLSPGSGQGIMKYIDDYGKKLEAVIVTRDTILQLLMAALHQSYRINKNVTANYGLTTILSEWKKAFKCTTTSSDNPCAPKTGDDCDDPCKLEPIFQFPISSDPYYTYLDGKYRADVTTSGNLLTRLTGLNKKKESLLACKSSLDQAIKEVDPAGRCK